MSNLFTRAPAVAGASGNGQFDSCSSPFFLSRGKAVLGGPAFFGRSFFRTALQSIVLFLQIVVAMMAMVKPAHASGVVPPSSSTFFGGGPSVNCYGLDSSGAVKSCAQSYFDQQFNQVLASYNANPAILNRPIDCTAPLITELGNLYQGQGSFVDAFSMTYYVINLWANIGGASGGIAVCGDPNVATYGIISWHSPLACPDHSFGTPITNPTICTCNNPTATSPVNYVPDALHKYCIPEEYTIALFGLDVTVMQNDTLNGAYAKVTKGDGTAKSAEQVFLLYDVVPDNDGLPSGAHEATVSPVGGGLTGSDGRLGITFTAPGAGGSYVFVAGCTNCTNTASGTIRVPGCQEPPLTELTDPVAIDFDYNVGSRWRPDGLTADYQNKLACVQREITARHGTYTGTSAYRPYEYQRHLYEIIHKDVKLNPRYMLAHPECRALRDEITHEMGPQTGSPPGHNLQYDQPVARPSRSNHEAGEAFDLTPHGLTDAQLTEVYTTCHVTHIAVPTEPWHTQ